MNKKRTAYLNSWTFRYFPALELYYLSGTIYDDSTGEFDDGIFMRTSMIDNLKNPWKDLTRGVVITTESGSKYTLGAKWQG